jgi:predicted Rossmann fold flavoprotein
MTIIYDLIVLGGGAAGVFASIIFKERRPSAKALLIEKSSSLLKKVLLTGGGRCNVTNACFDPRRLIQNYPRGAKELLSLFQIFQPKDMIEWLEKRGVELKVEQDEKVFPKSDSAQTIVNCLLQQLKNAQVEILLHQEVQKITKNENIFEMHLHNNSVLLTHNFLLATGNGPDGYKIAKMFGHSIQIPIPSLFTFNVPSSPLLHLSGITIPNVELKIPNTNFKQKGSLLLTHHGFSGPVVLKLSAFAAKHFYEKHYQAELIINWLSDLSQDEIYQRLLEIKKTNTYQTLGLSPFALPKTLWRQFLELLNIDWQRPLHHISNKELQALSKKLSCDSYQIEGISPNKAEFVTCGGVTLKEVDFRSMQSKLSSGLFFAGEILDIDGLTGGFNLQNAWTTGYIAGHSFNP